MVVSPLPVLSECIPLSAQHIFLLILFFLVVQFQFGSYSMFWIWIIITLHLISSLGDTEHIAIVPYLSSFKLTKSVTSLRFMKINWRCWTNSLKADLKHEALQSPHWTLGFAFKNVNMVCALLLQQLCQILLLSPFGKLFSGSCVFFCSPSFI